MATLIIQSADATVPGRVVRVDEKIVYLGRSRKCTVHLDDPTVSSLHAALTRQADGSWALVRHKAAQPVWVDGEAVDKRLLRGGETILIGGFTILFHAADPAAAVVDDETVRGQPAIAAPHDQPEATVWFEAGGPASGSVPLTRVTTVFGRDEECDVILDDQRCSRRHIEISRSGDAFVLRDLGSTNGVLVNGERKTGEVTLVSGDMIQVGETLMRFGIDAEAHPEPIPLAVALAFDAGPAARSSELPALPMPAPPPPPAPASGLLNRWLHASPFFQVASAMTAALLVAATFFILTVSSRRLTTEPSAMAHRSAGRGAAGKVEPDVSSPGIDEDNVAARGEQTDPEMDQEPEPPKVDEESEPSEDDDPLLADATPRKRPTTSTRRREPGSGRSSADEGDDLADAISADRERRFADLVERNDSQEAEEREPPSRRKADDPEESGLEETADEDASPPSWRRSDSTDGDSEVAAAARLAVPDGADIAAALENIKAVYAEDLANSQALGPTLAKLLSAAQKSSKPASKYALLVAAEQKAVQSRDFDEAIDVINTRADMFEVDALQGRLDMLREASKGAADHNEEIHDLALKVATDAIQEERFEVATKAAALVGQVATILEQHPPGKPPRVTLPSNPNGPGRAAPAADSQKTEAARQLRQTVSEWKRLHQKYEQARTVLEETPTEAKSLEVVGKYLCFVKGDWKGGLRALADGAEGVLQGLAARELALPPGGEADPSIAFSLAGDWWALADAPRRASDLPAGGAGAVKIHAAGIYERILDELADPIEAELAKKRIAAAADESTPWATDPRGL